MFAERRLLKLSKTAYDSSFVAGHFKGPLFTLTELRAESEAPP